MTNKQCLIASLVVAAVLVVLALLGGGYRAVGIVFLPLGLWLSLTHEPKERKIRAPIRVLGWVFVGVAIFATVTALIVILSRR